MHIYKRNTYITGKLLSYKKYTLFLKGYFISTTFFFLVRAFLIKMEIENCVLYRMDPHVFKFKFYF